MNKNISDKEIQILRLILGAGMVEEFLKFLDEKKHNQNRVSRNRSVRVTQKYVVDVSNFRERDLIGYWDYDECYFDDKMYFEPSWLRELNIKCRSNPNQHYTVVFTGVKKTDDEVYKLLEKLNKTGKLTDKFKLPKNARYSITKLPPRQTPQKEQLDQNENKHEEYSGKGDNPFDYTDYDVLK